MGNYISCFRADAPISRVQRPHYESNNTGEYEDQGYYGAENMTLGESTDVEFESLLNSQNEFPSTRLGGGAGSGPKRSFSFLSGSPFGTSGSGPGSLNRGNSFLGLSKPNIQLEDDPYIEGNFESAFLNEDEDEDLQVELMKDDQIQRISNLVDQQIKLNQVTNELQSIDRGTELSDKPSHTASFTEMEQEEEELDSEAELYSQSN